MMAVKRGGDTTNQEGELLGEKMMYHVRPLDPFGWRGVNLPEKTQSTTKCVEEGKRVLDMQSLPMGREIAGKNS